MVVKCEDNMQFMDVIEESIKRGLKFWAFVETLTIEYTGVY